ALGAPGTYEQREEKCQRLHKGLQAAMEDTQTGGRIQRVGSMLTIFFNNGDALKNFEQVKACNHDKFRAFFHAMLERGIYLPPSGYESWFVSLAHTNDDIDRTVDAARSALSDL
ncbi:unnamed protein product, partial [Laminaria digitata]